MNKIGKGVSGGFVIITLIALAILGTVIYFGVTMKEEAAEIKIVPTQITTEEGVVPITAKVSCPSDHTTDGQARYIDTLAATITQLAPTCYFMPKTKGQERVTAGTLSTTVDTYSTAVDLPCTTDGTKWRLVCVTKQDEVNSADEGVDFVASGPFVKRDVYGKKLGKLQVKVEDKYTGGAKYFNITRGGACSADGVGQGYITANTSADDHTICNDAAYTGTSLTLSADEYIDARFYIKANTTKRQFGEDGLNTWALVDADASEYDEPIVARDNGATLVNKLTEMYAEDIRKYSGYEYAYKIGSFGDRESIVDFYIETAAGVDASADPIIEFCAEGRYNSNKEEATILIGCWTDATTQAQVSTAGRHKFTFEVT